MRLGDCEDPYIGMRNPSINCRNPWFREFWSHHFNCRFADQPISEMPSSPIGLKLCTGNERVTKYEQEGLVPFVGKWIAWSHHCVSSAISILYDCDLRCQPWSTDVQKNIAFMTAWVGFYIVEGVNTNLWSVVTGWYFPPSKFSWPLFHKTKIQIERSPFLQNIGMNLLWNNLAILNKIEWIFCCFFLKDVFVQ